MFAATYTEITDERLSHNLNTHNSLSMNHALLIHHCVHEEYEGFRFYNSALLEVSSSSSSGIYRFSPAYYHV